MSALTDFADRLRAQVDIVEVISGYVELRRGGVNLKGLCPFHREKTPSFTVSQSKQMFHCFGCNEGGDVIKFVQKAERMEWIDALRHLAERYGLQMPELRRESGHTKQETDAREQVVAACAFATKHFSSILEKTTSGGSSEISAYLQRRKLPPEIVKQFSLGLAADAWQSLLDSAGRSGISAETLIAAGLVIRNSANNRTYDRFRKRLIFPIHNASGKPIAFGGRVYASDASPDEPKYVNSPETPLYQKGNHLYALHLSRDQIVRTGYALLMEGYMDVIRAHQFEFTNAVASCGTALTDQQARVLKKLCTDVVFVYDGDEAGQKAMLRGCEILLQYDFNIRVVVLPDGHDPDSYLVQHGKDAFQQQIDSARHFFDFFLEAAAKQFNRNTPDGKVRIVEFLLPLVAHVRSPIARHEYAHRAAEFLGVQDDLVLRQLSPQNPRRFDELKRSIQEQTNPAESRLEHMLLKLAVECPGTRERLLNTIDREWLNSPIVRRCLEQLCSEVGDDQCWDRLFSIAADEQEAAFLRTLAMNDEPMDACACSDEALNHMLARLEVSYHHKKNRLLAQQIQEFYGRLDEDGLAAVSRAIDEAARSLKDAGSLYFRGRNIRKLN